MTRDGYLRIAAGAPRVTPADVDANVDRIIEMYGLLDDKEAELVVMPELCVTGYTCADLFHQHTLLAAAEDGIRRLMGATHGHQATLVVGVPVAAGGALYNCAAIIAGGKLIDLVAKTFLPNYNEFYEARWFKPAPEESLRLEYADTLTTLSAGRPFSIASVLVGIEICEDLWAPDPVSSRLALAGAEVILNLSASNELIGKNAYLRSLIIGQSARLHCAYAYAGAAFGESSTDTVYSGKAFIAENGVMLAEDSKPSIAPKMVIADVDIELLRRERFHNTSFRSEPFSPCPVEPLNHECNLAFRPVNPTPFVPADSADRAERASEITDIQALGLARRLEHIGCRNVSIGISGGLDSTLALLVTVKAFDILGLDRKGIKAVTMPGFGTTTRTRSNADALMEALGVDAMTIPINDAVQLHFRDIGHDPTSHDVTYENSQARERTQILMDIANKVGGIVIGTGDLSELALGWATYNGDHISMYGVNAGVPKTLVSHLVRHFADTATDPAVAATLRDILDTPVSPELLPPTGDGSIAQRTEDLVGPYRLHDFFLYHLLRYGASPRRIFRLASRAFYNEFSDAEILRWLETFCRRFFAQQFKRSCLPDGPKIGSVCLSPRGDWRMPSDASSALWLKQIDQLKTEIR